MTRGEFIAAKGWSEEETERIIGCFWSFRYWNERKDKEISMYELWCDHPFHELNAEYNRVYEETDGSIGSLYDWLESTPTDDEVAKYLTERKG